MTKPLTAGQLDGSTLPLGYALYRWLGWRVLAVYRITPLQLHGRDIGPVNPGSDTAPTKILHTVCEQWVVKQREALSLARRLNKLNDRHRTEVGRLAVEQRAEIERVLGPITVPPPVP